MPTSVKTQVKKSKQTNNIKQTKRKAKRKKETTLNRILCYICRPHLIKVVYLIGISNTIFKIYVDIDYDLKRFKMKTEEDFENIVAQGSYKSYESRIYLGK